MQSNKPITFRPTSDAAAALESLVKHYQQQFQTLSQSDVINKAILELAKQVKTESK